MLVVMRNYTAYWTVYTVLTFLNRVTVNLGTNDIPYRLTISSIYCGNDLIYASFKVNLFNHKKPSFQKPVK